MLPESPRASRSASCQARLKTQLDFTAYTITTSNDGVNAAGNVTISVPYNPAALRFVGATFSQPDAWVSDISANALEIQTGSVGGDGGSVKAVLRFQPLSSASAQAVQRLAFTWTDKLKGGHGISNQLPSASTAGAYLPLSINQSAAATSFDSNAFASTEGVYFWYNAPDGTVIPTRVQRGKLISANLAEQKYRDDSTYDRGSRACNRGRPGAGRCYHLDRWTRARHIYTGCTRQLKRAERGGDIPGAVITVGGNWHSDNAV